MTVEDPTDGVTGERFAGRAGEELVGSGAGVIVEPVPDELSGGFVERGDAVLASFAVAADVGSCAEFDVTAGEFDEFRDT